MPIIVRPEPSRTHRAANTPSATATATAARVSATLSHHVNSPPAQAPRIIHPGTAAAPNSTAVAAKSFVSELRATTPEAKPVHEFVYTLGPDATANRVLVTGSFDSWAQKLEMKQTGNEFRLAVPLTTKEKKILFKFLVEGVWACSPVYAIEKDEKGNENNVLML